MDASTTILVAGASGHVGGSLVEQLHAAGAAVSAGGRDPQRLTVPAGVGRVRLDLDRPETFAGALAGVGKVFLYALPEGTGAFLTAARHAGVEHVVLLSSNTIDEWQDLPARKPIAEMHQAVEQAVVKSGIAYTFLRPAHFATNVLLWHWDRMIRADGVVRFPAPESYCDAIHERDIAAVAVKALTEPGHESQSYFLTGPAQVTQRRQSELIAEAIGRPVRYEEISLDEARVQLRGTPDWALDAVLAYWAYSDGVPGPLTGLVEQIIGRPALSFAQWAADHATRFAS